MMMIRIKDPLVGYPIESAHRKLLKLDETPFRSQLLRNAKHLL